jgi:hypothetical protein
MVKDATLLKRGKYDSEIFDVPYARRRAQRIQPARTTRISGVQAGKTCLMNLLNLNRHLKTFGSDEAVG